MTCQLQHTRSSQTEQIASLNDRARLGLDRRARIVVTPGLLAKLSNDDPRSRIMAQARIMQAVRQCTFTPDSPERDMAWFEIDGHRAMFKIDYYDESMEWASPDPSDASITIRVVTVMAPEDY